MTNNLVFINENGSELVCCSRADGLAFDVLRNLKKPCFIVSTEKNSVVKARARKLRIPVKQGIKNKLSIVKKLIKKNNFNINRVLFLGNDLNDFKVMKKCGYSCCPSDSHAEILKIADFPLKTKGGEGVVRDLLENVLKINILNVLKLL